MSDDKYILDDDGNPVPEPDLLTWARWFETAKRHLACDEIGDARISTVFLGIDHNFLSHGPPILWETMIFCPTSQELDGYCERYTSKMDALKGHAKALAWTRKRWKEIKQLKALHSAGFDPPSN